MIKAIIDEVIFVGDAMSDYQAASENSIRFIARIHDNESIFKGIECIKIMDLIMDLSPLQCF